jgi:predicted MPP superfamily phosphohydrolase
VTRPAERLPAFALLRTVVAALACVCCLSATRAETPLAQPQTQTPPGTTGRGQTPAVALPNANGTLKFAVLGDFGTGSKEQYQTADQMAKSHTTFPYDLVVLVGDNLYGGERPQDFSKKFEIPYKPLLDGGVKFYASLGNHDSREQRNYKPFNMNDKLYYSLKAPKQNVRFFFLESTYPDAEQIAWVENELKNSTEEWKIPVFHHPLYASGMHGSDVALRDKLEPLFLQYNVSVVFTGHEHFYERIKPQKGITYFVCGSGGQLRKGDIDPGTGLTAKGFDTDRVFLIAEIQGDVLYFNAISRTGTIIDSGTVNRRKPVK